MKVRDYKGKIVNAFVFNARSKVFLEPDVPETIEENGEVVEPYKAFIREYYFLVTIIVTWMHEEKKCRKKITIDVSEWLDLSKGVTPGFIDKFQKAVMHTPVIVQTVRTDGEQFADWNTRLGSVTADTILKKFDEVGIINPILKDKCKL